MARRPLSPAQKAAISAALKKYYASRHLAQPAKENKRLGKPLPKTKKQRKLTPAQIAAAKARAAARQKRLNRLAAKARANRMALNAKAAKRK